jgi:hypothetical protein
MLVPEDALVNATKRRARRSYRPKGLFALALGRWPAALGGDEAEEDGREAEH